MGADEANFELTPPPTGKYASSTATISSCGLYRYNLVRAWDDSRGGCLFIGLNPSTADESEDDPTIRRCVNFAKSWGYGSLHMANLFAYRATQPADMLNASDPIGPENMAHLARLVARCDMVIAAWGNKGSHLLQDEAVIALVTQAKDLHCLVANSDGSPKHPLYVKGDTKPVIFRPATH